MTALYAVASVLSLTSLVVIAVRPTPRSTSLALILLGLTAMAIQFTDAGASLLNTLTGVGTDDLVRDLTFLFSLACVWWWLTPRWKRISSWAYVLSSIAMTGLFYTGHPEIDVAHKFAFGHSLVGTVYSLIFTSWMLATGLVLVRLRPATDHRIAVVAVSLLRGAGALCATYAPLRLVISLLPEEWGWKGHVTSAIAASGIIAFALAVLTSSVISVVHNRRVLRRVDYLIEDRFGGRSPTGTEERLYLRGPLGRTADTIVNAAEAYPSSFPSLGGSDGVPLARLLIYLRVYE